MISLTPLIEWLRPCPVGFAHDWFRQVDGAAEYARLNPQDLPVPAAWVVRAADPAQPAGEGYALVTIAFDVVMAVPNLDSKKRGSADDLLLAYRLAVKDRLLGWEIEPGEQPIQFRGGQVLQYTDADLFWRDRYQLQTLVSNHLPDPSDEFEDLTRKGA